MQLELGRTAFDVSTHALVVATVVAGSSVETSAKRHDDQGAHAVRVLGVGDELVTCVSRIASAVSIPVIAATTDAGLAERCLHAGASAIDGGLLADPALLPVIAEADASVVVADTEWVHEASHQGLTPVRRSQGLKSTVERARWAEAAGILRSRIIVKAPLDQVGELAAFGYVVEIATSESDESSQGKHVTAVMAGARVVRSNRVRATKRTLSTVGELLHRRGLAAPNAVEFAGAT